MKKGAFVLLAWLALALIPAGDLLAQCYSFSQTTGSRMTGSFTNLNFTHRTGNQWGGIPSDFRTINLGFTFRFNEAAYTQVKVYHNGMIAMGNATPSFTANNSLQGAGAPILAPFWDEMRITDNMQWQGTGCSPSSVQYMITGTAPNRILVVDWDQIGLGLQGNSNRSPLTFQARLYEAGSKIEYWYSTLNGASDGCSQWGNSSRSSNASIGLAYPGGFTSVTPDGSGGATSSSSSSNDYIDIIFTPISAGTVYVFTGGNVTGNVAQGGTPTMAAGDTLLRGKQVVLSSFQNFNPFTVISPCASEVSYTLTGPSASEYTVTPSTGPLPPEGSTPTIRFAPTGIGRRHATLTVTAGTGLVRSFTLAGEGIPRTIWIGNIAQGGTSGMRTGDTLMQNLGVPFGGSQNFTPFTIQVPAGGSIPAPMTYTLTDPTGQFSINPTSQIVMPGGNAMPTITFAPITVGWQTATLVVNAEGEVRTFLLRAFGRGPGANLSISGEKLVEGLPVFRNMYGCVGAEVQSVPVQVENIGDEPFLIYTNDAYQTENIIRQGTPPYELLRDPFGELVPTADYFMSYTPGVRVPLPLSISIAPGAIQTVYLNFLATRPGKRQARAYFLTNGLNFVGVDTSRNPVRGMVNFELVGTGLGSSMTNAAGSKLPDALVFPPTEVRSTTRLTGYIRNNGDCDMTIPSADFRLVSGDVNEFKIVTGLRSAKDASGNYVIPPGRTDSFEVDFTPTRSGSRRASVWVRSNDSSIVQRGVSELGVYYLDVFGVGKVGIEGRPVKLSPAVIGGPGGTGRAVLENTSGEVVEITGFTLQGGNGEIIEDPANRWPILPIKLSPGQIANLSLVFVVPAGGVPGTRTATLEVTLSGGTVLTIDIEGLAGTQELAVAPTSLFQNFQISVGDVRRQFVAVTNIGTFPVAVQQLNLTETNPGDYDVSALVRGVMEPGQIEFYEVTYSPQAIGVSSGTLEIVSNATNGPHIVTLGGEGTVIAPAGGGSGTNVAVTGEDAVAIRPSGGMSGWGASMANGTLLWQSNPNPTGDRAEIRYYVPSEGMVEMKLYTSSGELVKELVSGITEAGEHRAVVNVRNLSSGRYYYTMRTSGGTLTLGLDVVK